MECACIMHIDEEALSGMTPEVIDRWCRNEGTMAKVLNAGDLLQNASAALTFRIWLVGVKAQRKIVDIKSGDFILANFPFSSTFEIDTRDRVSAQELARASSRPDVLIVGGRHRTA